MRALENSEPVAKPSICIVSYNAYGVLAGVDNGHSGGIEVQTPLLAKWLVKKGYKVSMITWDEGYEDGTNIDGVTLFKLCKRDSGIPIIRFFWPRWSSLIKALNRSNADIVYYNCVDLALGQIVLWAKWMKRKVSFSMPNEAGCRKNLPTLVPLRERILYKFGLARSDDIIVQTDKQKKLLDMEFGLPSYVIRMPCEGFDSGAIGDKSPPEGARPRILWVGRVAEVKRIEWLLDIAEQRPHIDFDVVGDSNVTSEYAQRQFERASTLKNVFMHGRISHDAMGDFYQKAHLLCSTSIMEGFPNVFLEAWSAGLPLVTTFDPDGVVAKYKQGRFAKDMPSLLTAVDELLSTKEWLAASAAAKRYFEANHRADNCLEKYLERFLKLVEA